MQDEKPPLDGSLSRRGFAALSLAAGVTAATGISVAGAAVTGVGEQDVEIKTAAGTCDAALIYPQGKGTWPATILFPDAFGLRPTVRDMAKRLAKNGYVVLIPNPYYRNTKAPGLPAGFDFSSPADQARFAELRAPLTNEGVGGDATAYVAFLDSQPQVNKKAKAGVFGYCMGGLMTIQASAAVPARIGAAASFHGGGLVTDQPDSPHLLVPKVRAQYYFGVAASDDERQPDAKTRLAEAFQAAKLPAKVEVYAGTLHGWCIKDMPMRAGRPIYDEPQAQRAWGELEALFKRALV